MPSPSNKDSFPPIPSHEELPDVWDSSTTTAPPVDRLPNELLAQCFSTLVKDDPPARTHCGWIVVTHVCHRWREVALNAASLWGAPTSLLGPQWFDEMLARSKSAALSVCHHIGGDHPSSWGSGRFARQHRAIFDLIERDLDRIEVIELFGHSTLSVSSRVVGFLTRPAPVLRELVLDTYTWGNAYNLVLPANFLGNQPSGIQRLSLTQVGDNWTSTLFSNLTKLSITGASGPSKPRISSYDGLFDMLRRNAQIQTLNLQACLPPPSINAPEHTPNQRISLPHLTSLRLSDKARSCAQILSAVVIPSTAITFTTSPLPELYEQDLSAIFSVLDAHRERYLDPYPVLSLSPSRQSITISFAQYVGEADHRLPFERSDHGGRLTIRVYHEDIGKLDPMHVMELAFRLMPPIIHNIEMLVVNPFTFESTPDIWSGLQPLQNIKYLRIFAGNVLPHLCPTSSCPQPDAKDSDNVPHLYPNLATLNFVEVQFATCHWMAEYLLLQMVKGRRTLGLPLSRLELTDCDVSDSVAEKLEEACEGLKVRMTVKKTV